TPGRGDRRHRLVDRLLHAWLGGALADLGADAVVDAVRDDRPAVVGAGADDVHLVAALRAVLVRPEHAGLGVQRRALLVAVAEVEFLRLPGGLADERIVLRHAAVVVQADHRARVILGLRGAGHLAAVAQREVDVAGAVEDDAPAEVVSRAALRA